MTTMQHQQVDWLYNLECSRYHFRIEIISQAVAKIPRLSRNPEEWQTGSSENAAIPTRIGEYQATLNDLPMFVVLTRILDWTIVKRCSPTGYWFRVVLTIERLLKDYWKIGNPNWKIRETVEERRKCTNRLSMLTLSEKVPATLNIVETLLNPTPPIRFQTVQVAVCTYKRVCLLLVFMRCKLRKLRLVKRARAPMTAWWFLTLSKTSMKI